METVTAGAARASTAEFPAFVRTATGSIPSTVVAPRGARDWRRRYARALRITDFLIIVCVVFGTQLGWLGFHKQIAMPVSAWPGVTSYTALSILIVLLWLLALAVADTRSDRVIGVGSEEYQRVFNSSVMLFGLIAIAAFLLKVEASRGYLLITLPVGVGLLLLSRYLWRVWLRGKRKKGEYSARVLLVGSESSVQHTADELRRTKGAGYVVAGACIPARQASNSLGDSGIPVMGGVSSVESALKLTGADTVVITSTDQLGPQRVKQISWALEAGRQHLVLAPSITDIAGPRIHTRPVAGLPLMHVETPRFSPAQRFVKRMMDIFGSATLLILLSPVLLVLSVLVLITSGRPVIYKQARIGRHGREFRMWKFRSMVPNAETKLQSMLDMQDHGNKVQFKMKNDPRVTPVGRVLRKYSLDELPQLFNVLAGEMSLVGPRPHAVGMRTGDVESARLVAEYAHRHRMKPGITGWAALNGSRGPVNTPEEVRRRVALDVAYIERQSFWLDLYILLMTIPCLLGDRSNVR